MGRLRSLANRAWEAVEDVRKQAVCTEAFCSLEVENSDSEGEEEDQSQPSLGLSNLDSPALQLVDPPKRPRTPRQTVLRDKVGFFLGLVNIVLTAYWLGKSPETWYQWYTGKAALLFTLRFFIYRGKKWGFYLLEFCYYANILLLLEIWAFPSSHILHKIVFGLCAGPITFSIPALRNSLVFHSLDRTTSLFMHLSPAVMSWCIRWHPSQSLLEARSGRVWRFYRGSAGPSKDFSEARWWELTLLPMAAYLLWAVLYYIKVFVLSSDKIFKQNYSNMYTLMVMNSKSGAAKLVLKAPQRFQPLVYLSLHCLLCWLSILAAAFFWQSQTLHTTVLILCAASSAYNGTTYFFDIFAHRYVDAVGIPRNKPHHQ